ncbi:MAG: exodeoxyribonuclease VII large subunit [Oceanicoccus sp.]|jgi:exodeoxyribonuclease VII large subunit
MTTNKPPAKKTTAKRETLSISQLNRQAKRLLEGNFPSVWVEGEISNLSRPSSGHWYFSLKDAGAQVRCAMFRSSNARLRFHVESGQQVMARAKLSLYEARGDYQLIVEHMEAAGDGALARAYEELKNKLQLQGWFDPDLKQALPTVPQHIAVITSPTGAAIRDILTVLARRFANIPVTIIPVAVQGQGAAAEIANAIALANQQAEQLGFDVILAGRGGGSIEDLWAFNEEVVAAAIFYSELPVVSAVGHETDFSIADFVADLRAPTPSAAAEILSPDSHEMLASFTGFEQLLTRQMQLTVESKQQQLSWLQSRVRHPGSRLQEHNLRLDELEMRLLTAWRNRQQRLLLGSDLLASRLRQQTPKHLVQQLKLRTDSLYQRLEQQIITRLKTSQQRLKSSMALLGTVNPLATLDRGYAIVTDADGEVVQNASQLHAGQRLNTRLAKGSFSSTVSSAATSNNEK